MSRTVFLAARIRLDGVGRADELSRTDAERACLAELRAATGEVDGAMERHCVRQFLIAERLGQDVAGGTDRELLLCAALPHDAGLYPGVSTRDAYVTDGRRLAERTLAPFDWPTSRFARCLDAIEQHHAWRSRWDWGAEVELIRRADLIDVSRGLVAFGLPRSWLRDLRRSVPWTGFWLTFGGEILRMLRERPRRVAHIFFPPGEPTRG
jgi:HD domain